MSPRLVALTDLARFPDPVPVLAELCRLAHAGAVAIVLRDRDVDYQTRLALGQRLRDVTRETEQLLVVSDRVDLALELGADGVHLPQAGLLPSDVERLLPAALLSRAHHDAELLPRGELARCDLLLVSPACAERKGRPPLGASGLSARFSALRALAPRTRLLALGGIDEATLDQALAAGADGLAAIEAAHDPAGQVALVRGLGIQR